VWTDNSRDETAFEVERAPVTGGVTGTFAKIGETGPNDTLVGRYTDGGVAGDQVYAYRVRAKRVNEDGSRIDYSTSYTNVSRVSTYAVPPVISIQNPLEGAGVSAGTVPVTLAASASNGHRVTRVALWVDGIEGASL